MSALWEAPSLASASLVARDAGAVSSRSPVGAQWEKRVSCNPARANGPSERAGSVPTAMMNELGADQPSLQAQRLHRPSRCHAELQQWRPVLHIDSWLHCWSFEHQMYSRHQALVLPETLCRATRPHASPLHRRAVRGLHMCEQGVRRSWSKHAFACIQARSFTQNSTLLEYK